MTIKYLDPWGFVWGLGFRVWGPRICVDEGLLVTACANTKPIR